MAAFPHGDHDDYVDSMTMALIRFRRGGFISLDGEEEDEWYPRRRSITDVRKNKIKSAFLNSKDI